MNKLVSVAGTMALLVGTAWGQADAPLSGPTVKPDRPAGLGGQFSDGKGDRKGPMMEVVPMRLYAEAVQKLRGESAPEGLKLSAQQDEKISAIETEFRQTMRAYIQKSRQENAKGQRARPEGENPAQPMEPDRARMQELMRNAPSPTDAQVKIYALLSPGQQKFVDGEVAKGQEELEKRRAEERAQRQLQKKRGDGKDGVQPAIPPGTDLPPEGRERARRIIERLQQLPPEEREQILRRLEEELDRRAAGGPPPRQRRGVGDGKPAPSLDEVRVPPPEKP